jgi:pimeloyl-ACP methyl ester carboxylesterase
MSQSHFAHLNHIQLHYLEHAGEGPLLILMPGLTANAQCFGGLIAAGLTAHFRVLALDLRGRGLSHKPATGYSMRHHAEDIVALLDNLGAEKALIGGHSFGAFVALYLGAYFPERVEKLALLDVAARLHPRTRELIQPSIDRLSRTFPSADEYVAAMKHLPQWQGFWDPYVEAFYRAELQTKADGAVQPITSAAAIVESTDLNMQEPWPEHVAQVQAPAVLINAPGPYGPPGTPPVISAEQAQETVQRLPACRYVQVPGNHLTMLFGENAPPTVRAITEFL